MKLRASTLSSPVPYPQPMDSTLMLVPSIVVPNPIGLVSRATDDAGGLKAYNVASRVIEASPCLLFTKPDDGELVIKMSSMSSRLACVDCSNPPRSVTAFTTSGGGGAHTSVTITSGTRVQVRHRTHCIYPTALPTPTAECPPYLLSCS